jgi:NAD dependent epimerase/dehydratase family enzyme
MLEQLRKTARLGFLLRLKKQDFWMSWIHEDDIVSTYLFALETTTVQGVFNASAPESVLHTTFMKTLGKKLKRQVIGSIPRFISKKLFGEFFTEITKSQRIAPKRLLDKGFTFSYPTLDSALNQILKK